MSFEYPKAGLGNVGNYQVSGIPYVTASLTVPSSSAVPLEITFPSVTQKIAGFRALYPREKRMLFII